MTNEELLALLEEGMVAASRHLVSKIKAGEACAADISTLRALFKDAGGSLTFAGQANEVGDEVLAGMADIDPNMLN